MKDAATRRALRDLYLPTWYEYLAQRMIGLTPWAPITDREAEAKAIESAGDMRGGEGFPEDLDEVPVLLVVLADLRNLATVDRDLGRYTMAGGASIYPFVWSILLAAYAEGLGGVMTTMVIPSEPEAKEMLGVPDELVIAAVVALGEPVNRPRKLTRAPVSSFTFVDRFGGEPFGAG